MNNFQALGYLRVAAASPAVEIGNPVANTREILHIANEAHDRGVSILVAPELCLSGYSAEDLFFSSTLISECYEQLKYLCSGSKLPLLAVGLPWQLADGRLLNCAAIIGDGQLLGLVPKSVHPNYGEFYDQRWFVSGEDVNETLVDPTFGRVELRTDQLFNLNNIPVGVEVCEDLWAPQAPSTAACLAGAQIILNLSASNELIAKADYRRQLVNMASAKNICAYVYASAGSCESTKDIVFGGHCLISENGQLLAQSERFSLETTFITADVDLQHIQHDRAHNTSFSQTQRAYPFRKILLQTATPAVSSLNRAVLKQPFVPDDEHEFAARAAEILAIQSTGLARRFKAARVDNLVIALSGGLDSTLAYLVCLDTMAKLQLDLSHLHAITMPGPGTTAGTKSNALTMCESVCAPVQEISIQAAVDQHLLDLKHEGAHDVVFENAQARERTQILFNYANKVNGLVVGTGDLSELALGWCTYNADHMASYNVNASVPKTMIAYLVRWYAKHRASKALADVLAEVLLTPISPELLPPEDGEISQKTEDIVGPYELHDFFLYHYLRHGSSPTKIFTLAQLAFQGSYSADTIKKWLQQFFQRFFAQQFKRTTLPPGPKVGSVSLSPRGDWRMPDEASAAIWLDEVDQLKTQ